MAKYPAMITTNKGRDLVSRSNATKKAITWTKIVVGDGDNNNINIATLTNVISKKLEITVDKTSDLTNGQWKVQGTIVNSQLTEGFYCKEIAVFAKCEGDADEVLFAYTNGGNYVDYIPDKTTPVDSQKVTCQFVVGNAQNVTVTMNNEAFLRQEDLNNHDADNNAHQPIIDLINSNQTALNSKIELHNSDKHAHNDIINTVPRISILTGTCSDGETIPLPDGYTESQCKIFVSMSIENPNGYWYDPAEGGARNMLKVECYTEGRILRCAMVYNGFDNWRTGRDSGSTVGSRIACVANYLVIGIKYGG